MSNLGSVTTHMATSDEFSLVSSSLYVKLWICFETTKIFRFRITMILLDFAESCFFFPFCPVLVVAHIEKKTCWGYMRAVESEKCWQMLANSKK